MSHTKGDNSLPKIKRLNIRSGRPRSINGINPPIIRPTIAITSAILVIGVRQPAPVTLSTAETNVPA